MKKIKLFIVDDHSLIRLGLKNLIGMNTDLQIVGEASDGEEALKKIELLKPDIVLLDIEMPKLNGLKVCEEIKRGNEKIKVIFLTMMPEEDLYLYAMQIHADGYLLKENVISELFEAIKTVYSNQAYHSLGLRDLLTSKKSKILEDNEITKMISLLTKTEKRVLSLIAEKKGSKEISEALFISDKTVKVHRHNIISKLQLSQDQSSLLKFAIEYRDYLG